MCSHQLPALPSPLPPAHLDSPRQNCQNVATLQNVFHAARAKSIYTVSHHISAKAPEIVIVSRRSPEGCPGYPEYAVYVESFVHSELSTSICSLRWCPVGSVRCLLAMLASLFGKNLIRKQVKLCACNSIRRGDISRIS